MIHVNNTATPGGDGTAARPRSTLAQGDTGGTINVAFTGPLPGSAVAAIRVLGGEAKTNIAQAAGQGISTSTNDAAMAVSGGNPEFVYQGQI